MEQASIYQPIPITPKEAGRLRLLLSTYQDGTGQNDGGASPGWRDFERAVALTFGGYALESKAIFDVLVPLPNDPPAKYGIACKMRRALSSISKTQRVLIEVSNSSSRFWKALNDHGITQENYTQQANAAQVGALLIGLVESWNQEVSRTNSGEVDLARSFYLVLSYTSKTAKQPIASYQLHQFRPSLPDPASLSWYFPQGRKRLVGADQDGITVIEWYGGGGGQLKYWPHESEAVWQSQIFQLESISSESSTILHKAATYFPALWKEYRP